MHLMNHFVLNEFWEIFILIKWANGNFFIRDVNKYELLLPMSRPSINCNLVKNTPIKWVCIVSFVDYLVLIYFNLVLPSMMSPPSLTKTNQNSFCIMCMLTFRINVGLPCWKFVEEGTGKGLWYFHFIVLISFFIVKFINIDLWMIAFEWVVGEMPCF